MGNIPARARNSKSINSTLQLKANSAARTGDASNKIFQKMRSSKTVPYESTNEQSSYRHSPCSCEDPLDFPFSLPRLLELVTRDLDQIEGSPELLQGLALIAIQQERTLLCKRLAMLPEMQKFVSLVGSLDGWLLSAKVIDTCLRRGWESQACELVPYLQGPLRLSLLYSAADKGWVGFLTALAERKVGVQTNRILSRIHVFVSRFRNTHKRPRLPALFGSAVVQFSDVLRVAAQAGQRQLME